MPETAQAVIGDVTVSVKSGGALNIYCDYGSGFYYVLQNGQNSRSKCTDENYDVDQILSPGGSRCIAVFGPQSPPDGYYKIQANKRYKISDLNTVYVYSGGSTACDGRPNYPLT